MALDFTMGSIFPVPMITTVGGAITAIILQVVVITTAIIRFTTIMGQNTMEGMETWTTEGSIMEMV